MSFTITYAEMRANFSPSRPGSAGYKSQDTLFKEIGWDAFIGNPNYQNTCAIRMSLAFMGAGRALTAGSHRVLKGTHTGKRVEVSMKRLATFLKSPSWLGEPEPLTATNISKGLRGRVGIIAFHGVPGYAGGGHIDLVDASEVCGTNCYFDARETWFWPLRPAKVAALPGSVG